MGCHMLNHTRFAAFDFGDAVVVVLRAGIDVQCLIDSSRQVCLRSLLGKIGAGELHLQTRFVRCGRYYVKVLGVHLLLFHLSYGIQIIDYFQH